VVELVIVGKPAPSFTAQDQDGKTVRLSDFKGKTVVLYFYPKDDTPGCTVEACGFRDEYAALKKDGAVVLGVSIDDERSHRKFIAKHRLPFTLLADTDKKIVNAYGVWGKKSFMGRAYMGIHRVTYIIDGKGIVRRFFDQVHAQGHAQEVLDAIESLK
jgi:thioredoxin-dependent peroxiredoxin